MAESDPSAAPFAAAMAAAQPATLPWADWVWRCWHRLHQDRPWRGGGMGASMPGRIAWRDALAWADQHGQDVEMLDELLGAMDEEYLAWYSKQTL